MKKQHTPGAWRYSYGDVYTEWRQQEGGSIYHLFICSVGGDKPDANGHLIAAAPDLLATLEELVNLMDDVYQDKYTPDSFTTQPARAAIAKARGKQ